MVGEQTPTQLAHKLGKVGAKFDGSSMRAMTARAAKKAQTDIEKRLSLDIGGDRSMSGWRPKAKLSVGYDIIGDHEARLTGSPAGRWVVVERGRKAGRVVPNAKGRQTLRTPWGPRTFTKDNPLHVGPTKGHKTWSRAADDVAEHTPRRVADDVHDAIAEVLG